MPKIYAIVPAAGQGTRMGDALPKQYLPISGKPMMFFASVIAAVTSLSALPGARSKLMVTEGNCSWCAIASGAVVVMKLAKVDSGTCALPVTAFGVAVVLVLVVAVAVVLTVAVVPVEVTAHAGFQGEIEVNWVAPPMRAGVRYTPDELPLPA